MKHVIICRTNGTVEDMGLTEGHDLRWYAEQIGAKFVELVHPRGLKSPYILLCDEEGRLKEKPVINFLGSWLYETHKHGEPIVGDVVIMKEKNADLVGMEAGEADMMAEWLLEKFGEAYCSVMAKVKDRLVMP